MDDIELRRHADSLLDLLHLPSDCNRPQLPFRQKLHRDQRLLAARPHAPQTQGPQRYRDQHLSPDVVSGLFPERTKLGRFGRPATSLTRGECHFADLILLDLVVHPSLRPPLDPSPWERDA